MPKSAGAARHQVFDRLENAVGKYGGKPYVNEAGDTVDGWVVFDSRRQARQAASEIAGDLGSDPRALRLSGDKADKWWYRDSNRVVGRERLDSSGNSVAGWRDDYHGHVFPDGAVSPPHVNVWVDDIEFHLFYKQF